MTIKTPYKSEIIEEIKVNTSTIDDKIDVVDGLVDTLIARLTSLRAGYLDNINNSNLATLPAISSARIGYLDNINQSGLLQVTGTRAGYLDNLSGGAVALNSTVAKEATLTHATYGLDKIKTETASLVGKVDVIDGIVDSIKVETDKIANATYGLSALNTDLDTLISNLGTVDTVVDAVESKVDAIKLKTDLLFSGIATEAKQNTIIGYIDTEVGAIKAKTDLIGASVATAGEYTSALSTIDAYFDVTTADATTDATIRDVVGRKTDTANTTVGTTSSLMRYTKGILGLLTNGTYGLSALETLVDDLEGRLTATRAGYLDYLASGTYGLEAIKTQTGEIYSFLSGYLDQAIKTTSSPTFAGLTITSSQPKIFLDDSNASYPAGIATEVDNQLLDYGANYTQLGSRDTTKRGGFFRIDLRNAYISEFFNLFVIEAGGSEVSLFKVNTSGDLTPTRNIVMGAGNTVDGIDISAYLNQAVLTTSSPTHVKMTLSQAVGTAPLTITSTTVCTNLNADMLDGYHASDFAEKEYDISGTDILQSNDTIRSTTSITAVKLKEIVLKSFFKTTVKSYYEMRSANTYSSYSQMKRDDTNVGTQRSTNSSSYVGYTENIDLTGGTYFRIYGWRQNYDSPTCYLQNQRILGSLKITGYETEVTEGY